MENEVPAVNKVDEIREKLEGMQGERIKVKANMGRSRIVERTGTLVQAHPSLFVVEVDERRGRTARQSYQYVDVLTGTVELFDNETGERLFNYAPAEPLDKESAWPAPLHASLASRCSRPPARSISTSAFTSGATRVATIASTP